MAPIASRMMHAVYPQTQIRTTATRVTTAPQTDSGAADFRALFTNHSSAPTTAPAASAPPPAPTPESVFGANPWETSPMGRNPNGSLYNYNPLYFASATTAAKVAQMLGGSVVETNDFTAPGSPFVQLQPNRMVQMPDGRMINAGLVAAFYTHGYPQSYIDGLIAKQIDGTAV